MSFERDMQEEMDDHLRQTAETYERRGMSPEEARLAARREFGNVGVIQEQGRDARGWRWLEYLVADLRYGFRQISRQRAFAASAVLILSLGIGLDAALYSVAQGAMFAPPTAVGDPGRLRLIDHVEVTPRVSRVPMSSADLLSYASRKDVFQSVSGWYDQEAAILVGDEVTGGRFSVVSEGYFATVQVPFALGSGFSAGADASLGVIVTHAFWKSKLQSSPDAVGKRITISGQSFVVAGVTPEKFVGVTRDTRLPARVGFLTAAGARRIQGAASADPEFTNVVARVRDDVSWSDAEAAVQAIGARNGALTGQTYLASLRTLAGPPPGSRSGERTAQLILLVVVGLIILGITTTNVASLFLVRAASRQREIAVRLSLGASRLRVVRQLLTESSLIAVAAAAGAVLVLVWARYSLNGLVAELPFDPAIDSSLFMVAAGLAVLSVFLFALSPALHATRFSVAEALKAATPLATRRGVIQTRFVVLQIALTQPFLVAAASAASQTFTAVAAPSDLEFEKRVLEVPLQRAGPRSRNAPDNTDRLRERLQSLPGVVAVTFDYGKPVGRIAALEANAIGPAQTVDVMPVGSGWAEMRRIAPVMGRTISREDERLKQPVVVLNTKTARALFGDANPIGRRVVFEPFNPAHAREVIGVREYGGEERPVVLVDRHHGRSFRTTYSIETLAAADGIIPAVRAAIREIDPSLEIGSWMATLAASRERQQREDRLMFAASLAGAGLALLLAGYGLYAIVAFAVRNRFREIGVRVVLGAQRRDIIALFVRQGARLALVGLLIGFPLSVIAVRGLQVMTSGTSQVDVLAMMGVVSAVLAVAWVATWIPARRAAGDEPITALRAE